MTDLAPDDPDKSLTRTSRAWLGGLSLAFCFANIIYLEMFGKSENTLHSSSLSWAWTAFILILGGIGFGSIAQYVMPAVGKMTGK